MKTDPGEIELLRIALIAASLQIQDTKFAKEKVEAALAIVTKWQGGSPVSDWISEEINGWTCMWRANDGQTASCHGRIGAIVNDALRLGATSIALAREAQPEDWK